MGLFDDIKQAMSLPNSEQPVKTFKATLPEITVTRNTKPSTWFGAQPTTTVTMAKPEEKKTKSSWRWTTVSNPRMRQFTGNSVAQPILTGLGHVADATNKAISGLATSNTTPTGIYSVQSPQQVQANQQIRQEIENTLNEKVWPTLMPTNYLTALFSEGSLNPYRGAEIKSTWSPTQQLLTVPVDIWGVKKVGQVPGKVVNGVEQMVRPLGRVLEENIDQLYPAQISTSYQPRAHQTGRISSEFYGHANISPQERFGVPKAERNFKQRKWSPAYYPGYQLKGLMKGSPLERQLSKQGTISVNQLNAYFNKASQIEKEIANKILSEQFTGQRIIDYNKFKKAVQDELITFSRKPQNKYSTYGMDRLGFNVTKESDGIGGNVEYVPGVGTNTFTLESPRIPEGNSAHYDPTTLMHSRTFTTPEEPNILYVLEGQSDAAQHTISPINQTIVNAAKQRMSLGKQLLEDFRSFPEKYQNVNVNEQAIENFINKQQSIINQQKQGTRIFTGQEKYLFDNNLSKIIQENLKFASERGQTKMRYPTRDTAIKIEGFKASKTVSPEHKQMLKDVQNYNVLEDIINEEYGKLKFPKIYSSGNDSYLINSETGLTDIQIGADGKPYRVPVGQGVDYHYMVNVPDFNQQVSKMPKIEVPKEWQDYLNQEEVFQSSLKNVDKLRRRIGDIKYEGKPDFTPDQQTILKKYADFPKLFQKLYKEQNVRTVTDAKGNTWYEVDVPKGYLSREWQFKKGGKLSKLQQGGWTPDITPTIINGSPIVTQVAQNRQLYSNYLSNLRQLDIQQRLQKMQLQNQKIDKLINTTGNFIQNTLSKNSSPSKPNLTL